MKQLTARALIMGTVLGAVLSVTNIYIGLKAGWAFGVAITACILSYAIWSVAHRLGLARTPMTILENNCMQSTASAAGYSTGGTLISAFAAYMLINERALSLPVMLAWIFFLSVLGVTMAIPMKRQMINIEQLRFPSGIAAAETLRALHAVGGRGARSARALGWAGLGAVLGKLWAEGLVLVSPRLAPFMIGPWIAAANERLLGPVWIGRTVMLSWEPMFVAAGAITGWHVGWSMLLGSVGAWMIFVPVLQHQGVIEGSGYGALVQWTLWGGVACMVSSGILSFLLQWRTSLRAFRNLGKMFKRGDHGADPLDALEALELKVEKIEEKTQVPVVRQADRRSLEEISSETKRRVTSIAEAVTTAGAAPPAGIDSHAAADLDAAFGGGEIEFVVEDDNVA